MIEFLDDHLKWSGLAKHAIQTRDARLLMCEAAKACVGVKETSGRNDGPIIEAIQKTVDGRARREAYCMSGVQTMLAYVEAKLNVTSPIVASELCQHVWLHSPRAQRVKNIPLPGAIAIWADVGKITGHAEIVIACDGKIFQAVGFNTSGTLVPGSTVNREGNGVYYTVRSMKGTAKRKLLGFLRPF